jgi:hypothetical protein
MTRSVRIAAAAVLALAGMGGLTSAKEPAKACCFNNPGFAGTCSVTPEHGENCGTILAYLNNPKATGKSYCGNTDLRGGWTRVACQPPSK